MKKSLRICPKCGSSDIKAELDAQSYAQGSIFNKYKCNKCGFEGILFPEVDIKKYKKK